MAGRRSVLCPDLDAAFPDGVNAVWHAGIGAFPAHPAFAVPLARAGEPLRFGGRNVLGFGIWSSWTETDAAFGDRAAQAVVHVPRTADDGPDGADWNRFVVEFRTVDPAVSVLVAGIPRGPTLSATVRDAVAALKDPDHPQVRFTRDEGIYLPVVDVDLPPVRFRFDDAGAPAPVPMRGHGLMSTCRQLGAVTPFLVLVMERPSRRPRLAVWVANTDVLAVADGQPAGLR